MDEETTNAVTGDDATLDIQQDVQGGEETTGADEAVASEETGDEAAEGGEAEEATA